MKKLFLTILTGALLFSCQNPSEENTGEIRNGDTKKVAISISKDVATRSVLGTPVTKGAETALASGKLLFFDNTGKTIYTYTLTAANIAAINTDTADGVTPAGVTGSFIVADIPSNSVSVAMIANNTGTELAPTTFGAFKTSTYAIASQASMAGATGTTADGQPNAIQGIALLDRVGTSASTTPANALSTTGVVAADAFTHKAAITLVPAVARIEIPAGAIKIKEDNDTELSAVTFNGIYVNNYSPTLTLGFAQTAATGFFGYSITDGDGMVGGVVTDWSTAYKALTSVSTAFYAEPNVALTNDETSTSAGYAFHVFPGAVPHIILRGANLTYPSQTLATGYWRIDKYWVATADGENSGTAINTFAPGFVYKINTILLGDTQSKPDPYADPVSVQVILTVEKWQETPVYVTPN